MADLLRVPGMCVRMRMADWWPVDKLIIAYLAGATLLVWGYRDRLPHPWWMAGWHVAAILLLVAAVLQPDRPGVRAFRHWYPLPYVASCYKEMSVFIPAIRGVDYDSQLARVDRLIWGTNPTVWLERWSTPWMTETLQWLYALFVPAVLLVAGLLWTRKRDAEFRYYAFLVSLGFLASYVGYFLVPARGPRFLLAHLQTIELKGLATFPGVRRVLDVLESAHFDCFPSGHTELTVIACWGSRMISPRLFAAYWAYTCCIVFATVYLRYHYTVDIAAGVLLAALLIILAPSVYKGLGEPRIARS